MDIRLEIALLTAMLTALGWFITYFLMRRKEDRNRRLENRMRRYESQIKEFYGPLLSIVQQLHKANEIQNKIIGKEPPLTGEDKNKVHKYFKDDHFLPLHSEAVEILRRNLHLAHEMKFPPSFDEYLEHVTQLKAQKGLWEKKHISSEHLKGKYYPLEFDTDLKQGLKRAREGYENCLESLE